MAGNLRPLRERQDELQALLAAVGQARSGQPQLAVVSGLRGVGKSFLLQHFLERANAKDFTTVYFEATEASERDQLRRFAQALRDAVSDSLPVPAFSTWEQALTTCELLARSLPLTIVIDEVTYLMDSTQGFASIVQAAWDQLAARASGPALTIVLAGSAVGLIEDSLGYRGPLFNRPTVHLRINPFTPWEAFRFTARPDPVRLIEAYAACGGYPGHLDAWDFTAPTDDNLLRLAGTARGLLLEDAQFMLASIPESHRRVLLAVGQGRSKRNDISSEVGQRIDRPLEALVRARLLVPATPLGAPIRTRPLFRVVDPYIRFWIRVLSNHVQRIEAGQGRGVLHNKSGEWQSQLGFVFEQAAREHAVRILGSGMLPAGTVVDEWWTTTGEQCQVDVLGMQDGRTVLIGEARWQRQPLGRSDLDKLGPSPRYVPHPTPDPWYVLWGRGGVQPDTTATKVLGYGPAEMLA